jgi:hypothetical protein
MARKTYDDIKTLCIICGDEIPKDRIMHGAITCSKGHANLRRAQLQAITDKKECRYCRRPSTPEDRGEYKLFRKFEQKFSIEKVKRVYDASLHIREEVIQSLHPGEKLENVADTEVIEVTVKYLRELIDAIGDYER